MMRRLQKKFSPAYIRSGLSATGAASDLRKLRLAWFHWRTRWFRSQGPSVDSASLQILAHLSTYEHTHGGAEASMQMTLAFLQGLGHKARVLVDGGPRGSSEFGGVEVITGPGRNDEKALYSSADLVFTQGRASVRSFMRAAAHNKPLALFVRGIGDWTRLPGQPDLVVFNAEWQIHALGYSGAAIVVHPPIDESRYRTTPGNRVTLINLNKRKGADLFGELVRRMPDVGFLGVVGMWGEQLIPIDPPGNLKIMDSQDDVRAIYSQTRVLLIPSEWESFGRVAIEAALSGIPVVASPNPGTLEALGEAAIYAAWSDSDAWVSALRRLDDPDEYKARSQAVREAAERFVGLHELFALERELQKLAV